MRCECNVNIQNVYHDVHVGIIVACLGVGQGDLHMTNVYGLDCIIAFHPWPNDDDWIVAAIESDDNISVQFYPIEGRSPSVNRFPLEALE